jgi:sugar lactone lactonase YvrE
MKRWVWSVACALAMTTGVSAAPPSAIVVHGKKLFTESLTSTADGAVIIGAMGPGAIYRAAPGAGTAEPWIKPGTDGIVNVLGVFADERSGTLWACSFSNVPEGVVALPSTLHAFDLSSGAPKGKWPLPTAGAICNDIGVGKDGTAYATDSINMEVVALRPGAKSLEVWAGHGAFGPAGGMLDGIAVLQDRLIVNALETGRLFSVPILPDGRAGVVTQVSLDRPLQKPDGHRSLGNDSLLIVDAGEGGRLLTVALSGEQLTIGRVTTLRAGFADGPASVTVVGNLAYVLEAQFETADKGPERPFKATAVPLAP